MSSNILQMETSGVIVQPESHGASKDDPNVALEEFSQNYANRLPWIEGSSTASQKAYDLNTWNVQNAVLLEENTGIGGPPLIRVITPGESVVAFENPDSLPLNFDIAPSTPRKSGNLISQPSS